MSYPRVRSYRRSIAFVLAIWAVGGLAVSIASAQDNNNNNNNQNRVFGIWVDVDGAIRFQEKDARSELAAVRARKAPKDDADKRLKFVSLVKLMADLRQHVEAKKPLPAEIQYVGGLTQIRYVLVYPEEKDLVIAGPAEEIDATNGFQPRGKLTGRPILQLDDLIVALRRAAGQNGRVPFGCSIDPPPNSVQRAEDVLKRVGSQDRNRLAQELSKAMGPQQVRLFGAPPDSRLAFVCVAADYQLKRYSIGLDAVPVPGVGHSIDNSRPAGNGFWFETMYDKLLVAPDGNAFEVRGQRLQLKAGAVPFDTAGATEKAKAWAVKMTQSVPALAATVPLYADLQNAADVALLAALIRQEKLWAKAGWDMSWVLESRNYTTGAVPVPRSTATLVNFTSGSVAAGGVSLEPAPWLAESNREKDEKGNLEPIRKRGRSAGNSAP